MYRKIFSVLFIALLSLAPSSALAVVIPAGLSPGDSYQLAFVTSGIRDATSFDISSYNTFVQDQAAMNPALTGTDLGVTWSVIGSTSSVDARDNALVSAPIYTLHGTTQIATGFTDFWDGNIAAPINVDQFGVNILGSTAVHTGTDSAGFSLTTPARFLGSSQNVRTGRTNLATAGWIDDGGAGSWMTERPFYALSSVLTVPVPEPTTALLASFGMLAILCYRRG